MESFLHGITADFAADFCFEDGCTTSVDACCCFFLLFLTLLLLPLLLFPLTADVAVEPFFSFFLLPATDAPFTLVPLW